MHCERAFGDVCASPRARPELMPAPLDVADDVREAVLVDAKLSGIVVVLLAILLVEEVAEVGVVVSFRALIAHELQHGLLAGTLNVIVFP